MNDSGSCLLHCCCCLLSNFRNHIDWIMSAIIAEQAHHVSASRKPEPFAARRPIWKLHSGSRTSCRSTCESYGHRNAVEDTPGQSRYVCRPTPPAGQSSTRIGWAAYQAGFPHIPALL